MMITTIITDMKMNMKDTMIMTMMATKTMTMLTTVTTILGLLPMVFQVNIDFVTREITHGAPSTQWWVSLASAIVFGLGFASILTMLVTPCALMVRENLSTWRAGRRAGRGGSEAVPAE